jgi:hypothetical protein
VGLLDGLGMELGWCADEQRLGRAIAGGLLHLVAARRLRIYAEALQYPAPPDPASERLWRMLMAQLWGSGRHHVPLADVLVRLWSAANIRTELVAPLQWPFLDAVEPPPPVPLRLHGCEGVFIDEATQCDVFFVTLKKSERLFSPTIRYNDYSISRCEFRWESQSLTRAASSTGQRYIHHAERSGVTMPFLCLGFADQVSHQGALLADP